MKGAVSCGNAKTAPSACGAGVRSREHPRNQPAADCVELERVALDALRHVGRARAGQHRRAGEPGATQATHTQTAHRVVLRLQTTQCSAVRLAEVLQGSRLLRPVPDWAAELAPSQLLVACDWHVLMA